MIKELSVRLYGQQVGLLKLVEGKMEFVYDETAQNPLSLSLPLQNKPFKKKVCRSFLGGLLSENQNIKNLLTKKFKISFQDDFKLLAEIGRDCAGAISLRETSEI